MANIMINRNCNLNCFYCFANNLKEENNENMSFENFKNVVNFLLKSKEKEKIGIIGGEPTIHPSFKDMISYLNNNNFVEDVIIFTNGILIDKYFEELSNNKNKLLINCNSIEVVGKNNYERIVNNIDVAINNYNMYDRIGVGLNIYDEFANYEFIFDILKRFRFNKLRISITVPNSNLNKGFEPLEYFLKMKNLVLELIKKLLRQGIIPYYDCNALPVCLLSNDERKALVKEFGNMKYSNILSTDVNCFPVIDILPDLSVIRCMGLGNYKKVSMKEFFSIFDIRSYFINQYDIYKNVAVHSLKCKNCYFNEVKRCSGGCLCYKIDEIEKIKVRINR